MSANRSFNLIVIAVLLTLTVLTIRQAWATGLVVDSGSSQPAESSVQPEVSAGKPCPFSPAELRSLRAEYLNGMGPWITRSESGPAGRQGGTLALLGCSR